MIFYEGEEKTTREIFYRERRMIREDWNRKKEEKRQKELEIVRWNEALRERKKEEERINMEKQRKEFWK